MATHEGPADLYMSVGLSVYLSVSVFRSISIYLWRVSIAFVCASLRLQVLGRAFQGVAGKFQGRQGTRDGCVLHQVLDDQACRLGGQDSVDGRSTIEWLY